MGVDQGPGESEMEPSRATVHSPHTLTSPPLLFPKNQWLVPLHQIPSNDSVSHKNTTSHLPQEDVGAGVYTGWLDKDDAKLLQSTQMATPQKGGSNSFFEPPMSHASSKHMHHPFISIPKVHSSK